MERQDYISSVNQGQGTSFPCLVPNVIDDNGTPHDLGFRVMHRHEDPQFIYVRSGKRPYKSNLIAYVFGRRSA